MFRLAWRAVRARGVYPGLPRALRAPARPPTTVCLARFAATRAGPAPDVVAELAARLMRRREQLLADPAGPSAAESGGEIKSLEALHRVWSEWREKQDHLQSTLQMSEQDPDKDMRELAAQDVEPLRDDVARLRREVKSQILRGRDSLQSTGAIIELKQGVGGQESTLFLGEMLRMYIKYCDNRAAQAAEEGNPEALGAGWRTELLSATPVDVSTSGSVSEGLREAILQVHGENAFNALRYEAGVHRVQRIPTTQNLGKLQTSTIAVLVLPVQGGEAERADDIVNPQDVKLETMRSRGAGGQHVNRTESAVRLTHLPTNITVSMQESRSQHQNRARAWEVLRARLLDRKLQADAASNRAMRRSQVASADRSERVRTYNFPQVRRAMSETS